MAELVTRLEGIPLALELAAARVRLLSVADINARLKDRFKLLTGGDRTLQKRQQTLRALVDWSYDLLNDNEKCMLGRLGVFVGGFDLPAAEAVCGAEPVDPLDVLDLVGSLIEKSLVMAEEREDGTRYRMLETIREYAREKLVEHGDEAATAARHCDYYFAFSKSGREGVKGADQALWIRRLETERENLRTAISLALGGGVDPFVAVKVAVALAQFWMLRGYASEGRGVIKAALALPAVQASELARAWALYIGAVLAGSQGDHGEARGMLEICLELRRKLGHPAEVAATLSTLALYRLRAGDPAAAAVAEQEALQVFQDLGDRVGETIAREHLGEIALYEEDVGKARSELEQALALARAIEHHEAEARNLLLLGETAFTADTLDEAQSRFAASLQVCRDAGDRNGEANALRWLGKVALVRGELEAARPQLCEALADFEVFEMRQEMVACIEDLADLSLRERHAADAARLAAAAEQARMRLALVRTPCSQRLWTQFLEQLGCALGADRLQEEWRVGERWETTEALRAALSPPSSSIAAS